MMQPYRYLLLDLDGTLTDPMEGITGSVAYALSHFGIQVDSLESLNSFIGPPLLDSFVSYSHFTEEMARIAVLKYRERFSAVGIYENRLYSGIEAFLRARKESGQQLVLATSKPECFAERILQHFDIRHYFTFVCGSLTDGTRSAKSEVIRHILDEMAVLNREEVLMIGDTQYDIAGAKQNGIRSLGVLYGYGSRESLVGAGADFLVKDVPGLHHFFQDADM